MDPKTGEYELATFGERGGTPAPANASDESPGTRLLSKKKSITAISAARDDGFTKQRSAMKRITPMFWAKSELRDAKKHGPANYTTELFIDLITAVGLQSINYLSRKYAVFGGEGRESNFWGVAKLCAYLFTPFWFTSITNMIYMNRFYCGDWVYNFHLLVTTMIYILLAVDVTQCETSDDGKIDLDSCYSVFDAHLPGRRHNITFKWGVVVLFIMTGNQFWRPYFDAPESRTFCMIRILSNYACAFLWGLTLLPGVSLDVCVGLTIVIFFIGEPISTGYSIIGTRLYSNVNFHKRIAKFTIIVLSQTVIPSIQLQVKASPLPPIPLLPSLPLTCPLPPLPPLHPLAPLCRRASPLRVRNSLPRSTAYSSPSDSNSSTSISTTSTTPT
jgi:hypothetical protein